MFVVKDITGEEQSIDLEDEEDAKDFAIESNMLCAVYDTTTGKKFGQWNRISSVVFTTRIIMFELTVLASLITISMPIIIMGIAIIIKGEW